MVSEKGVLYIAVRVRSELRTCTGWADRDSFSAFEKNDIEVRP